jgi:hypothetical protein
MICRSREGSNGCTSRLARKASATRNSWAMGFHHQSQFRALTSAPHRQEGLAAYPTLSSSKS